MNELETKLKSSDPKICELETRLAEKSQLCDNLTEQNVALKKQLEKEQVKNVELESSSGSSLRNEVSKYARQISDLELRLRADSKEKESLQTTIDILKDQLSESRQLNESRPSNNDTVNSTFSNSGLCRTCLDGSERLEDTAKKVQQLAVEIQQRTEIEVARLSTKNVTLLKENRELESSLRREQNLRHTLETKVTVCEHEIR
jgi:chromosome segregation ATPase